MLELLLMLLIAIIIISMVVLILFSHAVLSNDKLLTIGVMFTTVAFVILLALFITAPKWMAANRKAVIINETYGTNYTREDVFWSEEILVNIHK